VQRKIEKRANQENKVKLKINAYDHKIIHPHLQNILYTNIT